MISEEEAQLKLENRNIPIEEVRNLFNMFVKNKKVVGMVAMNLSLRTSVYNKKNESEEMVSLLRDISKNDDMGSRWAVAKSHHTPVDILETLSLDKVNLVRALVATNPNTPINILSKLFNDEKIVRDGLSGNKNTPSKLLDILAFDKDKMVRLRVAENTNTSISIIKKMLEDDDPNVSKAAEVRLRD